MQDLASGEQSRVAAYLESKADRPDVQNRVKSRREVTLNSDHAGTQRDTVGRSRGLQFWRSQRWRGGHAFADPLPDRRISVLGLYLRDDRLGRHDQVIAVAFTMSMWQPWANTNRPLIPCWLAHARHRKDEARRGDATGTRSFVTYVEN